MKFRMHSMRSRRMLSLLRMLFVPGIALIVGAAMPALSQPRKGADAMIRPRTVGGAEPRYLLFWRSPEQAPDLIKTIGEQGDGRSRLLGFGIPCATFVQEKQVPDHIHHAFAIARRY